MTNNTTLLALLRSIDDASVSKDAIHACRLAVATIEAQASQIRKLERDVRDGDGCISRRDFMINQLQAEVDRLKSEQRWIPVGERLPEKQINVLIFVVTGYKLQGSIVARYIPKITEPYVGEYSEFGDYDEATETTYCPAGWYAETAYMGDEYSSYFVDDKVTHWQPLPESPAQEQSHD